MTPTESLIQNPASALAPDAAALLERHRARLRTALRVLRRARPGTTVRVDSGGLPSYAAFIAALLDTKARRMLVECVKRQPAATLTTRLLHVVKNADQFDDIEKLCNYCLSITGCIRPCCELECQAKGAAGCFKALLEAWMSGRRDCWRFQCR